MQVNIHTAKTQLSKLIEAALNGEEVVIARGNKPVVRLMPVQRSGFRFGLLDGKIAEPPEFETDPEELKLWEDG